MIESLNKSSKWKPNLDEQSIRSYLLTEVPYVHSNHSFASNNPLIKLMASLAFWHTAVFSCCQILSYCPDYPYITGHTSYMNENNPGKVLT